MTIAAAYLVSEGLVLGSDSTSTVTVINPEGGTGVAQLLNHAQKVFEVGQNSRLAVCTWGAASLGDVSHRTLIAQLAESVGENSTVEEAANNLGDILKPLAEKNNIEYVGYYLGGWNPKNHEPACFMITSNQSKKIEVSPLQLGVCSFSGMPQFFTRVFFGYDPQLKAVLQKEIRRRLPDNLNINFEQVYEEAFKAASLPLTAIGYSDLPIREAIDFVYSYLHITLKAIKFAYGAPACGGPIEVGFISTDRRFRWVVHKPFSSAIIEQEGKQYETK